MTLRSLLCLAALASGMTLGSEETFRLYHGVTLYVNNPTGSPFDVTMDLRDLNIYANGPREVLFKICDPDGRVLARQVIPDDGAVSSNFLDRIGGWDHELQYYAELHRKGTPPTIRWGAWSDANRLATLVKRTFQHTVPAGPGGIYRMLIVGDRDHYATVRLSPELAYGVAGHHTWLHGSASRLRKSYIFIPKGTSGIDFAIAEPDRPATRNFRLTAPDGSVLFDGRVAGSFTVPADKPWQEAMAPFSEPGTYDGKLLVLDISDGPNDYLVKINLQQPREGPFADYCGMGSHAVYAPDPATANAIRGGTIVVDDQVFWHPFQVKFHNWLRAHPGHPQVRPTQGAAQSVPPDWSRRRPRLFLVEQLGLRVWVLWLPRLAPVMATAA